jgi:hypothetical protein
MEAQARRAATLKRLTRASALGAALLGVLIYAGIAGVPADVLGWFAAGSQPQVTTGGGTPGDASSTAPSAPGQAPGSYSGSPQAPEPYAGGPVRARSGGS